MSLRVGSSRGLTDNTTMLEEVLEEADGRDENLPSR